MPMAELFQYIPGTVVVSRRRRLLGSQTDTSC